MLGRPEDAARAAQRLKMLPDRIPTDRIKRVEALSFLGDDRAVQQACAAEPLDGQLFHHAAVAALRLGDEAKARRLWGEWLKRPGPHDVVNENLQDLARPSAERNGPWYQPLPAWLPTAVIDELMGLLKGKKSEEQVKQAARAFLARHPGMPALAKILLDRGDRTAREFVLHLANAAQTPELLAALGEFALGQRGADETRQKAAQIAVQRGGLAAGEIRMWLRGEWQPTLVVAMEIYSEPVMRLPMPIAKMLGEGLQALQEKDAPRAERILKKAVELAPDAPELWNNLAQAYRVLGRDLEAAAILRRNYEQHPGYFFSRLGMAGLLLQEGRPSEAADMLVPLLAERRLHRSEFAALCGMEIQVALARGLVDSARAWLAIYRDALPDHHQLPLLAAKVAAHTSPSALPWRPWRRRL
jgi:tetratricopeptide (TPR) repeat protein